MLKILGLCCLLVGILTLIVAGSLAKLRQPAFTAEWIILKVSRPHDANFDLYRMLSDGSHVAKLTTISYEYAATVHWNQPGWFGVEHQVGSQRQLTLLHLAGYHRAVLHDFVTFTVLYHDTRHVYLMGSVASDPLQSHLWVVDVQSGQQTALPAPPSLDQVRSDMADGGFVFWSSPGDLFYFRFGNPPQISRLTTRGDIQAMIPPIDQPGWVYFYAGPRNPLGSLALYRIQSDGSAMQLVADKVLTVPGSPGFYSPRPDTIYYWVEGRPTMHLVRAKPDGSEATPLSITLIRGWVQGWSSDGQWVYYRQAKDERLDYSIPSNLLRLNMQTGQAAVVMQNHRLYQIQWTPDEQWLVVLVDSDLGYTLYRMRPDGTEATVLLTQMGNHYDTLDVAHQVIFERGSGADSSIYTLNLDTFEIRPIDDGLPANRTRDILATLPMPETDWQPVKLMVIGGSATVIGILGRRPKRKSADQM